MVTNDDEGPKLGERWTIIFNGPSNTVGHGIRELLMYLKIFHMSFTTKLYFDCTNNIVEYEACIMGIKASVDLNIKIFEVYKDYALVI